MVGTRAGGNAQLSGEEVLSFSATSVQMGFVVIWPRVAESPAVWVWGRHWRSHRSLRAHLMNAPSVKSVPCWERCWAIPTADLTVVFTAKSWCSCPTSHPSSLPSVDRVPQQDRMAHTLQLQAVIFCVLSVCLGKRISKMEKPHLDRRENWVELRFRKHQNLYIFNDIYVPHFKKIWWCWQNGN